MAQNEFVHLHVHSHNSLLDGLSVQEEIAQVVAADGARAFAQTDHGFVSGAISGYNAAKKHGVKFIPGEEIYLSRDNISKPVSFEDAQKDKTLSENETTHLILLAKSQEGLRNLYKLSSEGATTGAHGINAKRITNEHLVKHSSGLISTTGCLSSRVSRYLKRGNYKKALEEAAVHRDIFGKENFFVELQNHNIKDQLKIMDDQLKLAKDLGVGLLATNDSHYTYRKDSVAHDHFLALQTGATTHAEKRFKFEGTEHYIKSADEMYELFPESEFPGACTNTLEVADMVEDLKLDDNGLLIPEFEYADFGYSSVDDMLVDKSREGLSEIMDGQVPEEYAEKLEYELEVIRGMGIQSYFLIVAAIMQFCRDSGIWVGPGRGSAAGSLVSYALRITKVDPIEHGLIFSRFLNEGRTDSMPDIDVDIEPNRRQEVVDYMANRWGDDRVVHISALQTFKAKSALERAASVHDCFDQKTNSWYPNKSIGSGLKATIPVDMKNDPDIGLWIQKEPPEDKSLRSEWDMGKNLRDFVENHPKSEDVQEIVEVAAGIQGRNRTAGIHPAGILITPGDVTDYFPIRNGKGIDLHVCQFNCTEVDQLNGLKMDLLGLSNLSVLELATSKIRRDLGEEIDLDNIPFDDPKVFEMLKQGKSDGVFQIESSGMKDLLRRVKPTAFEDISALIALFRPGPMGMNSHVEYADRKNGRKSVEYFHEDAEEILGDTYGLVVYQEQVMAIAQKFANYSEKEADDFRRAMGKKKADVMEQQHSIFVKRVAENGYSEALGKEIWSIVEPFAGYAFNKAHSVSYGFIAYQTAWLKANYYPQFVAAFIDVFSDRSASMSADAIGRGYDIKSPDINESFEDSKSSTDSISVGFNRVANFGHNPIQMVVDERQKNGKYKNIVDFVSRNPKVNRTAIESLIKVGAFSSLNNHSSRHDMLKMINEIIEEGKSKARTKKRTANANAGFAAMFNSSMSDGDSEDGEMIFNFGRNPTSKRDARILEKESLGFFVGAHPFSDFVDNIDSLKRKVPAMRNALSIAEVKEQEFIGTGCFYGVLTEYEEKQSRNGKQITNFTIDCGDYNDAKGAMFGHGYFTDDDLLSLVLIEGRTEEDTFSGKDSGEDSGFNLKLGFGVKTTIVQRESNGEINPEVLSLEAQKNRASSRKPEKSNKQERAERSSVHKGRSLKSIGEESINAVDLAKARQQHRFDKTQAKHDTESIITVSYKHWYEDLLVSLHKHIVFAIMKRSENEDPSQGRRIELNIDGDTCFVTGVYATQAEMSLIRSDLKKLSDMAGTPIVIGAREE